MSTLRWTRSWGLAGIAIGTAVAASTAGAYTAPYSTPVGITLEDVAVPIIDKGLPMFLWRRLGDANGNALYTYDADQAGKSSCYDQCAKDFPPFVADARAKVFGDWSIIQRDDQVKQWAYQGKPLYRYSGKEPPGEPPNGLSHGGVSDISASAQFDPSSNYYSPKRGWRRAAYTPEKTLAMPSTVAFDALAIANGFGFVDAATHKTLYVAPVSHNLPGDFQPVAASDLALPRGDFLIIKRKDDGTRQWTYRGEALYTYAGDYAPGEVTGIFTGDKNIQAALAYRNFMPPGVDVGHYVGRGPLMTNAKGQTLYFVTRFHALYGGRETRQGWAVTYNDAKSQGTEGCTGDCTKSWVPLTAASKALGAGFWEVVARADGSKQWAFKGSPVYTYVGDEKPGDINGNNRHVIVYGGSQGQIVYADAGGDGDPRDATPLLGNLNMMFAVGPPVEDPEAVDTSKPSGAGADSGKAAAKGSGRKGGSGSRAGATGQPGAGLYWHTVGLFY